MLFGNHTYCPSLVGRGFLKRGIKMNRSKYNKDLADSYFYLFTEYKDDKWIDKFWEVLTEEFERETAEKK